MTYKEILALIAIFLTFIGFFPYIKGILLKKIRPHFFSWLIWGITTLIIFLATIDDKGGVGAYPIGISAFITISIAFLSYKRRGDLSITLSDWFFLTLAISSIPLWYLTSDPFLAVILLTFIDILGFGPTFTKAFKQPKEESILFYAIFTLRNFVVILALENYTLTTVLFPSLVGFVCLLLIFMIIYRRA